MLNFICLDNVNIKIKAKKNDRYKRIIDSALLFATTIESKLNTIKPK